MVNEIGNDFEGMTMMIDGWSMNRFSDDCIVEMESGDENNDRNEYTVRVKLSDFDCTDLWR